MRLFRVAVLSFFLISLGHPVPGQALPPGTYAGIELGGPGGIGALTLHRILGAHRSWQSIAQVGLSGFVQSGVSRRYLMVVPLMAKGIFHAGNHHIQLGMGQIVTFSTAPAFAFRGTAELGYRYQKPSGKWYVSLAYTPYYSYLLSRQFQHWGSLGVGLMIKKRPYEK
ncbi:MAG: hypothetical protein AAFR61_28410 [Bacteroidota bacterium]